MCWTLRTTSGGNPIGITGLAVMSPSGWRTWAHHLPQHHGPVRPRRWLVRRVVADELPAVLVALKPLDDRPVLGAHHEDVTERR